MSYRNSRLIEGATGSKPSDEKSLAYKNAATANEYLKNGLLRLYHKIAENKPFFKYSLSINFLDMSLVFDSGKS